MSTSNGKITAPVTIGDVARTIGVASGDLGTLCTSGHINKWSRYKPINRVARTGDGLQYVHPLTDIDFADSRYGLKYPTYHALQVGDNPAWCTFHFDSLLGDFNSEQESQENIKFLYNNFEANLINPNDGLFYGKPFGKVTYLYNKISKTYYSPYRLSDFDKYEHSSVAPLASAGLQPIDVYKDGIYAGTDYKITIEVKRATEGYNGLTVDSMISDYTNFPSETLSDWYLCVLIFDRFGGTCYGMFNCEGSSDKYYKIGSSSTSFTFEAKSDYLRRLSNMFSNTEHFALLSIVPTIMRQNFASFDNNGFYPTFSYKTTDGKSLLNSFLPMERGVWWLNKININGLVLTGGAQNYQVVGGRMYYTHTINDQQMNIEQTFKMSYTYTIYLQGEDYDAGANRRIVPKYNLGYTLYVGDGLRELVTTNKRCITIGDYYKEDNKYLQNSSGKAFVRPLFRCKVLTYDGSTKTVKDAMLMLRCLSNNAVNLYLRVYENGTWSNSDFYTIGANYSNLKSLKFYNIVDANDNITGVRIEYRTINWSAITSTTAQADSSTPNATVEITEDSPLYESGNGEVVFFYIPPTIAKDEEIINSTMPLAAPDGLSLSTTEETALIEVSTAGIS